MTVVNPLILLSLALGFLVVLANCVGTVVEVIGEINPNTSFVVRVLLLLNILGIILVVVLTLASDVPNSIAQIVSASLVIFMVTTLVLALILIHIHENSGGLYYNSTLDFVGFTLTILAFASLCIYLKPFHAIDFALGYTPHKSVATHKASNTHIGGSGNFSTMGLNSEDAQAVSYADGFYSDLQSNNFSGLSKYLSSGVNKSSVESMYASLFKANNLKIKSFDVFVIDNTLSTPTTKVLLAHLSEVSNGKNYNYTSELLMHKDANSLWKVFGEKPYK